MEKATTGKKMGGERISLILLIAFGAAVLILLLWSNFGGIGSGMTMQQSFSYSDLIDTKEIAALSVSEFVYNGIAQSLKDNGDPDYNVLYKSTVKVSADAGSIRYTIDEEQKTVTFTVSELSIEKPAIDVDSISLIPNKRDLVMKDVIALCRNDALAEAKKSEKLISSAQENYRSIIEGWYAPVLPGYTFEFVFDTAEGGEAE